MLILKITVIHLSTNKVDGKEIPMQRQNRLFIILTAVLMLAFMLSLMGGSASASSPHAPKTKTPTPTVATSTPIGPSPTPGPTQTPGPAPTVSSIELTSGWSLKSANTVTDP